MPKSIQNLPKILRAFPSTIDPKFTVRLHHRMQICPPHAAPKAPGPDAAVTSHRLLNISDLGFDQISSYKRGG